MPSGALVEVDEQGGSHGRWLLPGAHSAAAFDRSGERLAVARGEQEAVEAEEAIWILWMRHPNRRAALVLDRATGDIAGRRFDIAETRLVRLLRACPDAPLAPRWRFYPALDAK